MKTEKLEHKKKYMDYMRSSEWAEIRADIGHSKAPCKGSRWALPVERLLQD